MTKDAPQNQAPPPLLVVRDVVAAYWLRLVVIAGLSGAVIVCQTLAVSIVMFAITQHLSLPGLIREAIMGIKASSGLWLPLLAFALAAISAGMVFLHSLISVNIMTGYEKLCAARLLRRLEREPRILKAMSNNQVLILLSKDCRFGGRIAYELSNAIFPVGAAVVGLPILFYLNTYATLSLMLVVILAFGGQMLLRRKAQEVSQDMEDHAVLDKTAKADFLKALAAGSETTRGVKAKVPSPQFMDTYRRRLTIPHLGNLAGGLQYALALAVTIFWFTVFPQEKTVAGNLVLYLFVAMFVLSQMRVAPKVFMNFHMFYNYFSRAFAIILNGQPQSPATAQPGGSEASILDEEF
ncbi:MAG: hypothetical protein KJ720_12725 [Proteobacteria bacterium]|nr:hypothetical protein [Pseudomonadota bacterium]MBU1450849.1 hypothetical protein [Pseudomonadota bacterium]MBU2470048.1 hypothetical protein [Pseudomonadota bacterium]MBU2518436.1 hypothetical protein [Pseudomonadota bacterium]